ncbi:hypothetical protein AK812_SmicGene18306 [Symbiodinium microadriaticum]|uniref:Uncharacterized protein n=1 Tax=Symbiodinium microadriaticum TaxID=2951 RepID=A0A1Q9DVG8_SYMMI|nr:hypothetical protein AK812_SmicGene18306 [Symbiodinium microadriaticum]
MCVCTQRGKVVVVVDVVVAVVAVAVAVVVVLVVVVVVVVVALAVFAASSSFLLPGAGEIVTAFKNKVTTVPLICDGFITLTNAQQKQILANYGITMEDVKSAQKGRFLYVWEVVIEMCKQCKISMKVFGAGHAQTGPSKAKARILITGSVTDAEGYAPGPALRANPPEDRILEGDPKKELQWRL